MKRVALFVYGSLRRGERLDLSDRFPEMNPTFVCEAFVKGYRLQYIGDEQKPAQFPGLLPSNGYDGHASLVKGEVWEIDEAGLPKLDVLEGMYNRITEMALPDRAEMIDVQMYVSKDSVRQYLRPYPDGQYEWPRKK